MIEDDKNVHLAAEGDESKEAMDTAYKWTCRGAGIMTVLLIFIWPLFSWPAGTFSKSYFAFWVLLHLGSRRLCHHCDLAYLRVCDGVLLDVKGRRRDRSRRGQGRG